MSKDHIRCFIALPISKDTQDQIAKIQKLLKKNGAQARWITPSNIHITLRFLGGRPLKKTKTIAKALPTMFSQTKKFTLTLNTLEAFPNNDRPRVVWLGSSQRSIEIANLFDQTNIGIAKVGIPKEHNEFIPHVTIARCKTPEETRLTAAAIKRASIKPIKAQMTEVIFYQSILDSNAPIYQPLASIML